MRQPEHVNEAEMLQLLREAYVQDAEQSILGQLARRLRDPATPRDANAHPRPHPLWLTVDLIAAFVLAVFLYFSFVRPSP